VSLNVVNGFAGQFSIGHAAFMAVGAYTAALDHHRRCATCRSPGIPAGASDALVFVLALLAGMALAVGGRPAGGHARRSACAATTWPS